MESRKEIIIRLRLSGYTTTEISEKLKISESHLWLLEKQIREKYGAKDNFHLIGILVKGGMIDKRSFNASEERCRMISGNVCVVKSGYSIPVITM